MKMSEKLDFDSVQRRHSAVMAKYEWTSSLMSMQKTGNEIHDRRSKTHRKANEFLEGLLQKRSDGSLLDDDGALDRYQKFLKYKSNWNDDDLLNEFDRRLRALNKDRRHQTSRERKTDLQPLKPIDRVRKSVSKSTLTSNNSLLSPISSEEKQTNTPLKTDEYQSSSEQSLTSSFTHSIATTLHKPKVRRADGTDIIVPSTVKPIRRASSDVLIFHQCYFPRSLKSREQGNSSVMSEAQVLPSPLVEQYDYTDLFHLLDRIENDQCSSVNFTGMLDQLSLSSVQTRRTGDNLSSISNHQIENEEEIFINLNLFDQPGLSQEYYTTLNINIDDPKQVSVYTMTIGIVQLSPSLTLPYSILNGRRPLLQSSTETKFRKISSNRSNHIAYVTAIESFINTESFRENDIILKIEDQSVSHLTTEAIRELLQQGKQCLVTVARLSQPFI